MGKKKAKPNAFSEFMFEFINKERKMGRHHVKEQWSSVAKPHWEKLTQEQKEHYKVRAKGKPSRVYHVPPKYTSQGIPIEDIEREQKELADKKKYMELTIKNWITNGQLSGDLVTKPIIFIMANYFYKTHELVYSPAEIAISKFSIEKGLHKYYHTFVNPPEGVQIGYAFEAKDRYERVHRLKPPPEAIGEFNYDKIFASILDILGIKATDIYPKGDERRPMVFIRKEDMPMIESILDQLAYDNRWREMFDLFEFELLFNELKNAAEFDMDDTRPRIPMSVSSYFIEQDRFDLTPGISCQHHEDVDASKVCALSYTRRWFYIIADHIATRMNVTMGVGTHIPENLAKIALNVAEDVWKDEIPTSSNRNSEPVESYHVGYGKLEDDSSDSDDD